MKAEDRGCFNCEAGLLYKVPMVENGRVSESAYWALMSCRQKLSDHYKHYVEITHVCAWHSDSVQHDKRYPQWHESIDLPKEKT